MAAVIGRDFDLDVLAAATKTSEDDLLDILEAAESVALVREPSDRSGRYSFAHALIQHTLYEGMGSNRRARAHIVWWPKRWRNSVLIGRAHGWGSSRATG